MKSILFYRKRVSRSLLCILPQTFRLIVGCAILFIFSSTICHLTAQTRKKSNFYKVRQISQEEFCSVSPKITQYDESKNNKHSGT